jgi:gas vesicle protein
LIGGLIGATVALLTAPQAGELTRREISHRTNELKDQAMETVEQKRQQAEQALSTAKMKVTEASRSARLRAADMMHTGAKNLEETVQEPTMHTDTIENI